MKKYLPEFLGVALVAFSLGVMLQFQLGLASTKVCFEDGSCKTFTTGAEMRAWYGV